MPVRSLDRDGRPADAHSLREGSKAFQQLAQEAADLGTAVDILGTGMSAVNVPLLSTIARISGGSLTLHAGARLAKFPRACRFIQLDLFLVLYVHDSTKSGQRMSIKFATAILVSVTTSKTVFCKGHAMVC